jgi:hypothetical protein
VFGAQKGSVPIVVKVDEVFAPPYERRMAGNWTDSDTEFEHVRPVFRRAEFRCQTNCKIASTRHLSVSREYALKLGCHTITKPISGMLRFYSSHGREIGRADATQVAAQMTLDVRSEEHMVLRPTEFTHSGRMAPVQPFPDGQ